MRSDSACDDDNQEQGGDDASNTVEYDHGHSRRGRRTQWALLLLHATIIVAIISTTLDLDKVFHVRGEIADGSPQRRRVLLVGHGQDGEILHHILAVVLLVITIVRCRAIQDNACDVCIPVGVFEDTLGFYEAGIIVEVAADVCDVAVGDVGEVGEIGVVQVALDLVLLARVTPEDKTAYASLRGLPG